ncbi:hypothetical protein [Lentzea guizhouensis]|uniref:hypothetical protein n=1 Tax=Lentzea guizhouensis TaxID=1586287 RepID=UPI000AF62D63|nr:hypothetical protein [Lentzea guizhouensis]
MRPDVTAATWADEQVARSSVAAAYLDHRESAADVTAATWADEQVARVRDDPAGRLALMERCYHGPLGTAPRHLPFRRAARSFMRWQLRGRGRRSATAPAVRGGARSTNASCATAVRRWH